MRLSIVLSPILCIGSALAFVVPPVYTHQEKRAPELNSEELERLCATVGNVRRILLPYPNEPNYYLICQYGKPGVGKCPENTIFLSQVADCI